MTGKEGHALHVMMASVRLHTVASTMRVPVVMGITREWPARAIKKGGEGQLWEMRPELHNREPIIGVITIY